MFVTLVWPSIWGYT